MAIVSPPGFLQNAGNVHTAEVLRSAFNGLIGSVIANNSFKARGGVHPSVGGQYTVTQNGTPNMSVLVDSGQAFVPGTEGTKQGNYDVLNDASVNLAITASNPSNPRIDLVVLRVQDSFYSGATNAASLAIVTGTAAAVPAIPAAPANSLILAQIAVGAGVTSIVNANITDRRQFISAVGGILTVLNNTERDATFGANNGLHVFNRTTGNLDYWSGGTGWRPRGISRQANLAAGLSQGWGLTEGLVMDIADLDTLARYNGTAWMPLPGLNVAEDARTAGDYNVAAGVHSVLHTVTFTAVAGIRYDFMWQSRASTTNTANQHIVHIRHASGGSITTSSTSVVSRTFSAPTTGGDIPIMLRKTFVASATGSYTAGITLNFFSGVGTTAVRANGNDESIIHIDVARQS